MGPTSMFTSTLVLLLLIGLRVNISNTAAPRPLSRDLAAINATYRHVCGGIKTCIEHPRDPCSSRDSSSGCMSIPRRGGGAEAAKGSKHLCTRGLSNSQTFHFASVGVEFITHRRVVYPI